MLLSVQAVGSDPFLRFVISNVDELLGMIEAEPKTKKWTKRAKKGTSKQWWQAVEEVHI